MKFIFKVCNVSLSSQFSYCVTFKCLDNKQLKYSTGLTRQIESFKERDKQVQNDMIRLEKKAALAESARDQLESEKKADLDMMHTRMETWKERTEVFLFLYIYFLFIKKKPLLNTANEH